MCIVLCTSPNKALINKWFNGNYNESDIPEFWINEIRDYSPNSCLSLFIVKFPAYQVFGSAGKFAVEIGIIGFLMGTCVAYFVVVGDLGPQIIAKMLNLNQSSALR